MTTTLPAGVVARDAVTGAGEPRVATFTDPVPEPLDVKYASAGMAIVRAASVQTTVAMSSLPVARRNRLTLSAPVVVHAVRECTGGPQEMAPLRPIGELSDERGGWPGAEVTHDPAFHLG